MFFVHRWCREDLILSPRHSHMHTNLYIFQLRECFLMFEAEFSLLDNIDPVVKIIFFIWDLGDKLYHRPAWFSKRLHIFELTSVILWLWSNVVWLLRKPNCCEGRNWVFFTTKLGHFKNYSTNLIRPVGALGRWDSEAPSLFLINSPPAKHTCDQVDSRWFLRIKISSNLIQMVKMWLVVHWVVIYVKVFVNDIGLWVLPLTFRQYLGDWSFQMFCSPFTNSNSYYRRG